MFKNLDIEAAQYEVSEWESQHGLKLTSRAYKDLVDLVLAAQLAAYVDKEVGNEQA